MDDIAPLLKPLSMTSQKMQGLFKEIYGVYEHCGRPHPSDLAHATHIATSAAHQHIGRCPVSLVLWLLARLIVYRDTWANHCVALGRNPSAAQVSQALRQAVLEITATLRADPWCAETVRIQNAQIGRQVGHHLGLAPTLCYLGVLQKVFRQWRDSGEGNAKGSGT